MNEWIQQVPSHPPLSGRQAQLPSSEIMGISYTCFGLLSVTMTTNDDTTGPWLSHMPNRRTTAIPVTRAPCRLFSSSQACDVPPQANRTRTYSPYSRTPHHP